MTISLPELTMQPRKIGLLLFIMAAGVTGLQAQTRRGEAIAASQRYLSDLNADLRRSYYDPSFHGVNIDAAYDSAKRELKAARTDSQRYRALEHFLEQFDDSHTFFVAPWRLSLSDYHFGIRFIGETPYIMAVDVASHADSVGLRKGDQIVSFDGRPLKRESARLVIRDFLASDPIKPLPLQIRGADGSLSAVTLTADTSELSRMKGSRFRKLLSVYRDSAELNTSHVQAAVTDSIFIWRLPQFTYADKGIEDVIKRAVKYKVMIIDLRGNSGGSVETLSKVLGYFVDQEVMVGDLHMRTSTKKFVAKPNKLRFTGRVFVLTDSETGSAAEIFARIMQLQQKAVVVGDRTAGAVLASNVFQYDEDAGASISVSDFILYNGERLEKVGVQPDLPALMGAHHIAAESDPVLALALLRAGARVSPAAAARVLPVR